MPAESYPRYSRRRSPSSRSGFASRSPTYPMIPHIPTALLSTPTGGNPSEKRVEPGFRAPSRRCDESAELLGDERGDPSTEAFGLLIRRRLGEDADDGLGAGGADEHAARSVELAVDPLDLLRQRGRKRPARAPRHVLRALRIPLHHRGRLGEPPPVQRAAEQQRRRETVARHVVAQADDVARLLAAEDAALAVERLEDVAVADVGRDHADAALLHEPMEAEVRHRRDGDEIDSELEREHRDDLIAVDRRAVLVDGCSELLECARRDVRICAVRAVDRDAEPAQIGAEALEHVLEVAVDRDADTVDLTAAGRGRVEQPLDLLLDGIAQLMTVAVEELDAVVLRRVVRGRDDDAEIEPKEGDGRRRHDTREHRGAACRRDAARERLLELATRRARVAADEDAAASR